MLEPGEIIAAATFPISRRAAYIKFLNQAARYAMVGVFASYSADGGSIAVTGAHARGAFRWREAEAELTTSLRRRKLTRRTSVAEKLVEDLFADAAYRSHLTAVLPRRAVALAGGPAPGVMVLSHGSRAADQQGSPGTYCVKTECARLARDLACAMANSRLPGSASAAIPATATVRRTHRSPRQTRR